VLVSRSTLTTKQHFVVDVLGGALVAGAVYLILSRGDRQRA